MNTIVVLTVAAFIKAVVKYPWFRKKVIQAVEDGDDVANKEDARHAVLLYFACLFGVLLVNLVLFQFFFERYEHVTTALIAGVFLGLLGIKKFT